MSLPREHQNSLAAFGWLVLMLAAGILVWIAVMAYHNKAHADGVNGVTPPANAWVIVGEVRAIDDPHKFMPLGPYGEDKNGKPARDRSDYRMKVFQEKADCDAYLETDTIKEFVKDMNRVTLKWHPPGAFRVWCDRNGNPA